MFEYIRGKLVRALPNKAIVDVGGVGYSIYIGLSTYAKLPEVGKEVLFHVAPVIREDAHLLFGFLTTGERDLFDQLNLVSGVGPKTAMALLGHMDAGDLQMALLNGNVSLLSKVPGIGKKTAERLVIEMRDRVKKTDLMSESPGILADAVGALINLGYHPVLAQKAVKKVLAGEKEPELGKLITAALRSM